MQTLSRFLPVNAEISSKTPTLEEKYEALRESLRSLGAVVIGFSGGADSALLARVAHDVLGDKALAVIALSESYPKRERDDALALAAAIGVPVLTVEARELEDENYASNPTNRCYYCKAELFTHLARVAEERGIRWIAYGANHDDLGDYRPGQTAAHEFGARAPLLEVGMTKAEIRHLSKALGLATWDKPALACLSSRFPYGTRITAELLARLDAAEDFLRHDLGFRQVRVRHHDTIARLEVDPAEMNRILDPDLRQQVSERLKALGYTYVAVELGGYKSGSLNAAWGIHMDIDRLAALLGGVQSGEVAVGDALERLRSLPYDSVGDFAQIDTHRAVRTGAPEVVYCPGKSEEQVAAIMQRLTEHSDRVLATRATTAQYAAVKDVLPQAVYHPLPRLITVGEPPAPAHPERYVAVLTAGTADTPVGEEAALTLEWHGSRIERLYDVGVAGLHRLLGHLEVVQNAHALVVCAGMEGALASVVAGLVSRPVVAVPTSVGYGTSFGGVSALLTMLNSCAGGVAVVNIDNGFGAAVYAHRINSGIA